MPRSPKLFGTLVLELFLGQRFGDRVTLVHHAILEDAVLQGEGDFRVVTGVTRSQS